MASDQTLPLPPLLLPSSPNPNQKLPIKRRSPPRPSSSPSSSAGAASSGQGQNPPFKFQRIWSESDELRFLQGLLGCGAQGLVFPRDLNVFYDRFSESMPQPYTRSQLSEKLRRLKNKHRNVASRVARGLDPARLAPHDRDVLHLCSRLWDPANAATSPFAAAAAPASSSGNKRRRSNPAVVPPQTLDVPAPSGDSNSHGYNGIGSSTPGATAFPDENGAEDVMYLEQESGHHLYFDDGAAFVADGNLDGITLDGIALDQAETMAVLTDVGDNGVVAGDNGVVGNDAAPQNAVNNGGNSQNGNCNVLLPRSSEHRMARAVLDVFEECLREAKADGIVNGGNAQESELARRWRAQRIDELDVLSRRLRLIIEDATAAGH
ncbi:probable transcription factor At3g04930 [Triticum dicoccoides]|uniref:probable transcription factor At3g04930 n=1 Tax=Triticum dicoccoides TaxID=85692 RepID=UPI00188F9A5B|nr:probable transcription factor At3g04930 [Triticum dicoccoides]